MTVTLAEAPWWTGLRWALVLVVVAPMLALAAALGTHANASSTPRTSCSRGMASVPSAWIG